MMLLTVLASCFGFIGASANIFQVHKIFKRKSAKDISIISYSILFLGTVVWIFYGIDIRSIPVIITNLTMMSTSGL
jgi:MtN3 and saliva related transmembrane protein